VLQFEGGILVNGNIRGNRTRIKADRIKIFENINLTGSFHSTTGFAYPEWYGIFPYNNTLDIVDGLEKLDDVFFDISIGPGDYFTKKGEYSVKGIAGTSMATSRIIMETEKSNTFLFFMGKIGGTLKDRSYTYNYIKDLTLFITSKTGANKLRGNKGIIIGAVHKPYIENVKVQQSESYQRFTQTDLEQFVKNGNKLNDANIGIDFNGDSELTHLRNVFTLADVGIVFSKYTDIVYADEYINVCGLYGIANIYIYQTTRSSKVSKPTLQSSELEPRFVWLLL